MSIVRKTVISVIITTLLVLALLYLLSYFVYLRGFDRLERQTLERNVSRATEALYAKIDALNTLAYDWAVWDDTYKYVQTYNQIYVERNLQDETFSSSGFDIFAIFDKAGQLVYGKAYDIDNDQEIALPGNFLDQITQEHLLNPIDRQNGITGIVDLKGPIALIASRQILTSLANGPSMGTLILGKFMDNGLISDISATTHLNLTYIQTSEIQMNPDYQAAAEAIKPNSRYYNRPQKDGTIAGYSYVYNIDGEPAFMMKVVMNRDIHDQGVKAILVIHTSLLFLGIVFCIGFVFLMRRLFLDRLTAMKKNVDEIGSGGNPSARLPDRGHDELSGLAGNINNMMDAVEKLEKGRRSQREIIDYIVANSPNATIVLNDDHEINLANKAFGQMFGIDEKTITGKKFESLDAPSTVLREVVKCLEGSTDTANKEIAFQYQGHVKTLLISLARLKTEKLSYILITDITEERVKQERLYLTDRLASVGEMASGIAHELNNPLTSVIGLSEMLASSDAPADIKEDLAAINSEAKRAAAVVKNMLSFARKHLPMKQNTQLNKILTDVLKLRAHEQKLNNIETITHLAPDLPEINADFFQIQQVFINIILNAEQAMYAAHNRGTLTITSEAADSIIRVSIADDGPGIEHEYLNRIFDPFFTTKEVGKGTGLGLSISYGIISAHKGTIYAVSEPGKGATFVVELPVNDATTEGA
jgi:PAS domain S-box-containing protein